LHLGELVRELIDYITTRKPTDPLNTAMYWVALRKENAPLLELLLTDKRIDPTDSNQYLIRNSRQPEIVKVLLADPRVDPSAQNQQALYEACSRGNLEVAKLLLADPRVDPSAGANQALSSAALFGRPDVVKLLLADKRVVPCTRLVRVACINDGNGSTVKSLLADKRVDPCAEDQCGLIQACVHGRTEVVKVFLADPRIDPSRNDQSALKFAFQSGHLQTGQLLLSDQRVDPSHISPCPPSSSNAFTLFSLRRSYRCRVKQVDCPHLSDYLSFVADIEKIDSQRKALLDEHLLSDLSNLCLDYVPDMFHHGYVDEWFYDKPRNDDNCKNQSPVFHSSFSFSNLSTL
jgi:hypothetical protein